MVDYWSQLYFVAFIILGAFFILNLFIGVIIDQFNRLKQQYEDGVGIFLTPRQRNWINTLKAASLKKPSRRLTRPTVSVWLIIYSCCCFSIPFTWRSLHGGVFFTVSVSIQKPLIWCGVKMYLLVSMWSYISVLSPNTENTEK